MKLSNCYVLIEDLQVPEPHHFEPVGENIAETLEKLRLNDPEEEEKNRDSDGKEEMSEDESEPEIELKRQKNDETRDKGVRKNLTGMQKTKLI